MSDTKNTFAKDYQELEEVVKALESGEADLEQAIPQYKKGLKLAKSLKDRLDEMRNEIEEVTLG